MSISHAIDKAEDAFNIDSIGTQDIPPDEHLPHREDDKEETVSLEDIPICAICISPLTEVADVIATFCGYVLLHYIPSVWHYFADLG